MAISFDEKKRHMVPRWRDSRTPSQGELARPDVRRDLLQREHFDRLRAEWITFKSVEHASDFVGAALVNGRTDEARDAAEFVLREAPDDDVAVRQLAQRLLYGPADASPIEEDPAATAQVKISRLKRRLREDPRNSLAWADLAREYIVRGQAKPAVDSMEKAVALAPENRFVLRSACALFVHTGDGERALRVVRSAERTRSDPWLMAAEIAAAEFAERKPASVKVGQRLVAAGAMPPLHLSELAGALATEELNAGSAKNAKKLFAAALQDPTENTVAQAEWASASLRGIPLEPRHLRMPHSFEANARDARANSMWRRAVDEAWRWLLDQPFSQAPALMGSYLAGIAIGDHKEAIRIAERGLIAHPDDRLLRNNLAVSLALSGRVTEAHAAFKEIKPGVTEPAVRATLFATAGLLSYRGGFPARGREYYEQALEMLRAPGFERMRAVAALHLAREELIAGGEGARDLLSRARHAAAATDAPEVVAFAAALDALAIAERIFS